MKRYAYSWTLLKELVKTDFKLRYKGSVLGIAWSALKPLMLFAIMYVVFVHFLRFGEGIPHFAVSMLLGVVLWTFFSESTGQGMRSIVDRGDILRKINIPKYVIVISTTASALINLGINLIIVLIFALINGVSLSPTMLLIFPLVIELFIFSVAVSMLLAALYVKFRDIAHIWDVVLQGAFYATPIIYPLSMVLGFSQQAGKLLLLNPMAQIIQDARWALIYSGTETIWTVVANPIVKIIPIILIVLVIAIAYFYFKRNAKYFTEIL